MGRIAILCIIQLFAMYQSSPYPQQSQQLQYPQQPPQYPPQQPYPTPNVTVATIPVQPITPGAVSIYDPRTYEGIIWLVFLSFSSLKNIFFSIKAKRNSSDSPKWRAGLGKRSIFHLKCLSCLAPSLFRSFRRTTILSR